MILPVIFSHPDKEFGTDNGFKVNAVLDTGADYTTVHWELTRDLDLPVVNFTHIKSATDVIECPVFVTRLYMQFSEVDVFEYPVKHVIAAPLPGKPYCLIGMDILNQWKLTLQGGEFFLQK